MAKKIILTLGISLAAAAGFLLAGVPGILKSSHAVVPAASGQVEAQKNPDSARIGEMMLYDVKMGMVKIGTATFRHLENAGLNGRTVRLMQFDTDVTRFRDTEKIYSDPETGLPLKVLRDILSWPMRENITEEYDTRNYSVTITKRKGKESTQTVIRKDKPIQNAILLPHFVRNLAELAPGMVIPVNLPTKEVELKLVSIDEVKVPAGKFKAYHFESTPRQIEIWISADERRVPLKLMGLGMFSYVMLLREYQLPQAAGKQG